MADTNNTDAAVESSSKDGVTEERFNEQCYLLVQWRALAESNKKVYYKNFVQLDGHPSILTSKLLGTGVETLFSVTPAELSLLHPKLKLYKTVVNSEGKEIDVEIPFNETIDNRRLEGILQNREQRGSGVGIKSFEWEDTGTNPGDTGKAFTATLVMVFATMSDVYREFGTNVKASYADLIRYARSEKGGEAGVYHDSAFRIKATVGWQVPLLDQSSKEIIRPKVYEALANSVVTLGMTLVHHEIDIDQNGQVIITANYIGAIEGKMLSPETDVLYVGSTFESKLKDLERRININKKSIQLVKEAQDRKDPDDTLQDQQENFERLLQEASESKEALIRENKLQSYSNLLRAIHLRGRIFFIDVDDKQIELFNELRKTKFDSKGQDSDKLEQERIQKFAQYKQQFADVPSNAICANPNKSNSSFPRADDIAGAVTGKSQEDREKALEEAKKKFSGTKNPKSNKVHRINFIHFGDIVDAALQSMFRLVDDNSQGADPAVSAFKRNSVKNFRFILGTVEFYDLKQDKIETVPLADIPISLDLFNMWFLKKVIEPGKSKYLLRDFLRDICSELIVKALSPDALGQFSRAYRNRVSFSVFNLRGDSNPLNPRSDIRGENRIHIDDISARGNLKSSNSTENSLQYLMMYISGLPTRKLRGDFKEDTERYGIPHFHVGSDRGLLKNIKFKKVDMQYVKESRIANSTSVADADIFLSEPYNADMFLVGVPHFKPGMMVYIDPASIGFPKSIDRARGIPLGGYHTIVKVFSKIESGKFETVCGTNFESFGNLGESTAGAETKQDSNRTSDPSIDTTQ